MQFVGDKNQIFTEVLPATGKYPELKLSEFQSLFHFLNNETEAGVLHQAKISRIKVHIELKDTIEPYADLTALSQDKFGDEESGGDLYKQAVFALTAAEIIGIKMSSDATKDAADRQEALNEKKQHCEKQYRQAVDMLIHGRETYCLEMV